MKYIPALTALGLVVGSLQACSSDETAPAAAPSPDGSAGASGSGTGGRAGGAGTGGARAGGAGGIGGADARGPEPTGQACESASDCFFGIDAGTLSGAVECITKVPDG